MGSLQQVEDDEELLRRPRILSEDDLDAIAGRVALEMNVQHSCSCSAGSQEDIISNLPIDEVKRSLLREYISEAAEALQLSENEVLFRILTVAYDQYRPAPWTGIHPSLGDYDPETIENIYS